MCASSDELGGEELGSAEELGAAGGGEEVGTALGMSFTI